MEVEKNNVVKGNYKKAYELKEQEEHSLHDDNEKRERKRSRRVEG